MRSFHYILWKFKCTSAEFEYWELLSSQLHGNFYLQGQWSFILCMQGLAFRQRQKEPLPPVETFGLFRSMLSLLTSVIKSSDLDLSKWCSISLWLRETSRLCLNVPQCAAFQIQLRWLVESLSSLSLTGSWVWMDCCPITKTSNLKVSYHFLDTAGG